MKQLALILLLFFCNSIYTLSQDRGPKIGEPLPKFKLHGVPTFNKSTVTPDDLLGKWVILEFWFPGCSSCIKRIPIMNSIYNRFKGDAYFFMIGLKDNYYTNTTHVFDRILSKETERVPAVYDSVLIEDWEINAMPHIVIADKNGIVKFITDGRDFTEEKVSKLITNQETSFYLADSERPEFDPNNDAPESKIIFKSILTSWNGESSKVGDINVFANYPANYKRNGFNIAKVPLVELYKEAYIGHASWQHFDSLRNSIYPQPILLIKDSSQFIFDYNDPLGKGLYNYSLRVPTEKVTAEYLKSILQADLAQFFGYDAQIEEREVEVYKLVVRDVKKLPTKASDTIPTLYTDNCTRFFAKNISAKQLVMGLSLCANKSIPIFENLEFDHMIDLNFVANMTDVESVNSAIERYGLSIRKEKKKMNALVIRNSLLQTVH